jgi:inorganic pyrophosphatase
MTNAWHDIELGERFPEVLTAVVEIPRGSNVKYKLEAKSGLIEVGDFFPSLVNFPANYGFFPKTIAADGDALDVFIIGDTSVLPLTLVESRPVGCLITHSKKKGKEHKVIAVSTKDQRFEKCESLDDLPAHYVKELEEFYGTYRSFKDDPKTVKQVISAKQTWKIIKAAAKDYEKYFKGKK